MPEKESYNPSETTEDVSTPWDTLAEIGQDTPATAETPEEPQEKPKVVIDEAYLNDEKNAHNGEHFMTEEENAEYQRLFNAGKKKEAVRFLRQKWGEHADQEFLQTFRCVHWVSPSKTIEHLEEMLGNGKREKEISTQAYSDGEGLRTKTRWLDAKVGLLIDGPVTLASNDDIQTNQWHGVVVEPDDDVKRRKYTSWANRLMTSRENCVSPYEFVKGDWKPKAIIADPDAVTPELQAISEKYGIPIITTDDESLFADKEESE